MGQQNESEKNSTISLLQILFSSLTCQNLDVLGNRHDEVEQPSEFFDCHDQVEEPKTLDGVLDQVEEPKV